MYRFSSVMTIIAVANLGCVLTASAQTESKANSSQLEEVLVTAERRAETVQDASAQNRC